MSDIEYAVKKCKGIEALLEEKGAGGRGLHRKISSIEDQLDPALVRKCRFVATIRNKIVHDNSYRKIDDKASFTRACKEVEKALRGSNEELIWLIAAVVAVIAISSFIIWRMTL